MFIEDKQDEVDLLNFELNNYYKVIDSLLASTLDKDDFVDLEKLRVAIAHPPFTHEYLRNPTPPPEEIVDPPRPVRSEPPKPHGLFGRKKRLEKNLAIIESKYEYDCARWRERVAGLPVIRNERQRQYEIAENNRKKLLSDALNEYERECVEREKRISEENSRLDQLINDLSYGTSAAVQKYIEIVLARSDYPDFFPVQHTVIFEPKTGELKLYVNVPGPDRIQTIRTFKYVKSADEIRSTYLPQKEIKDRYKDIICSVSLRSLHEVFEADRRGLIQDISLELGTNVVHPATGRDTYIQFVGVAVSRSIFAELDLSAVIPTVTLEHLGGVVSKNPHGLTPVDISGVRRI